MLTDDSKLRAQLGLDEHLLWSGQPAQGIRFHPRDLVMVPFSLAWGGFAIFWEWSVARTNAHWLFMLWGVPFVLIGLYLIVGRFFWDAWERSRTYYGLTNRRVMIVTAGRRTKVQSLELVTLGETVLSTSSDGSGSIQFGSMPWAHGWWSGSGWPGTQGPPSFETIPDAKRVHEMVRQAQAEART